MLAVQHQAAVAEVGADLGSWPPCRAFRSLGAGRNIRQQRRASQISSTGAATHSRGAAVASAKPNLWPARMPTSGGYAAHRLAGNNTYQRLRWADHRAPGKR